MKSAKQFPADLRKVVAVKKQEKIIAKEMHMKPETFSRLKKKAVKGEAGAEIFLDNFYTRYKSILSGNLEFDGDLITMVRDLWIRALRSEALNKVLFQEVADLKSKVKKTSVSAELRELATQVKEESAQMPHEWKPLS
jgi:hypothetical protein